MASPLAQPLGQVVALLLGERAGQIKLAHLLDLPGAWGELACGSPGGRRYLGEKVAMIGPFAKGLWRCASRVLATLCGAFLLSAGLSSPIWDLSVL